MIIQIDRQYAHNLDEAFTGRPKPLSSGAAVHVQWSIGGKIQLPIVVPLTDEEKHLLDELCSSIEARIKTELY